VLVLVKDDLEGRKGKGMFWCVLWFECSVDLKTSHLRSVIGVGKDGTELSRMKRVINGMPLAGRS